MVYLPLFALYRVGHWWYIVLHHSRRAPVQACLSASPHKRWGPQCAGLWRKRSWVRQCVSDAVWLLCSCAELFFVLYWEYNSSIHLYLTLIFTVLPLSYCICVNRGYISSCSTAVKSVIPYLLMLILKTSPNLANYLQQQADMTYT